MNRGADIYQPASGWTSVPSKKQALGVGKTAAGQGRKAQGNVQNVQTWDRTAEELFSEGKDIEGLALALRSLTVRLQSAEFSFTVSGHAETFVVKCNQLAIKYLQNGQYDNVSNFLNQAIHVLGVDLTLEFPPKQLPEYFAGFLPLRESLLVATFNNLAAYLRLTGNVTESLQYIEQAYAIDARSPITLLNFAALQFQLGRRSEAVQLANTCLGILQKDQKSSQGTDVPPALAAPFQYLAKERARLIVLSHISLGHILSEADALGEQNPQALNSFQSALSLAEELLGPSHSLVKKAAACLETYQQSSEQQKPIIPLQIEAFRRALPSEILAVQSLASSPLDAAAQGASSKPFDLPSVAAPQASDIHPEFPTEMGYPHKMMPPQGQEGGFTRPHSKAMPKKSHRLGHDPNYVSPYDMPVYNPAPPARVPGSQLKRGGRQAQGLQEPSTLNPPTQPPSGIVHSKPTNVLQIDHPNPTPFIPQPPPAAQFGRPVIKSKNASPITKPNYPFDAASQQGHRQPFAQQAQDLPEVYDDSVERYLFKRNSSPPPMGGAAITKNDLDTYARLQKENADFIQILGKGLPSPSEDAHSDQEAQKVFLEAQQKQKELQEALTWSKVVLLQAFARAFMSCQIIADQSSYRERRSAASIRLQAVARGYLARSETRTMRFVKKQEKIWSQAASKVQDQWRTYFKRKLELEQRAMEECKRQEKIREARRQLEIKSAIIIQSAWKSMRVREWIDSMDSAAMVIQRNFHFYRLYKLVAAVVLKRRKQQDRIANMIQAGVVISRAMTYNFRYQKARRQAQALAVQRDREQRIRDLVEEQIHLVIIRRKEMAAVATIEAAWMAYASWKTIMAREWYGWRRCHAALAIQCVWRCYQARIQISVLKTNWKVKQRVIKRIEHLHESALVMQRFMRMVTASRRLKAKAIELNLRQESATHIQRIVRGHRGRVKALSVKLQIQREEQEYMDLELKNFAARTIQQLFIKILKTRKYLWESTMSVLRQEKVVKVQCAVRQWLARMRIKDLTLHRFLKNDIRRREEVRVGAVVRIQNQFRRNQAWKALKAMQRAKTAEETVAVLPLQRACRVYLSKKCLEEKRAQKEQARAQLMQMESLVRYVIVIQSAARMWAALRRVRLMGGRYRPQRRKPQIRKKLVLWKSRQEEMNTAPVPTFEDQTVQEKSVSENIPLIPRRQSEGQSEGQSVLATLTPAQWIVFEQAFTLVVTIISHVVTEVCTHAAIKIQAKVRQYQACQRVEALQEKHIQQLLDWNEQEEQIFSQTRIATEWRRYSARRDYLKSKEAARIMQRALLVNVSKHKAHRKRQEWLYLAYYKAHADSWQASGEEMHTMSGKSSSRSNPSTASASPDDPDQDLNQTQLAWKGFGGTTTSHPTLNESVTLSTNELALDDEETSSLLEKGKEKVDQ